MHMGQYDLAICRGIVLLNSLNYWRKPDYSWRRYIDIACVYPVLGYSMNSALRAPYGREYFIVQTIGCICFPIGIYYYHKGHWWTSVYFHCGLHIISGLANIIVSIPFAY